MVDTREYLAEAIGVSAEGLSPSSSPRSRRVRSVGGAPALPEPTDWLLGAAQLGHHYGLANQAGEPDEGLVKEIVAAAVEGGAWGFDTAQIYGKSEERLGRALRDVPDARVTSKFSPGLDPRDASALSESLSGTLGRVGEGRLVLMYAHDPSWIEEHSIAAEVCVGAGLGFGCSVYEIHEVQMAGRADCKIDLVQAPSNAWLPLGASGGAQLVIRSVFLQGLLVIPPERVAIVLPAAAPASRVWHAWCADVGLCPAQAAVAWAQREGCAAILGAETPEQVIELADWWTSDAGVEDTDWARLRQSLAPYCDRQALDPRNWVS